MTQIVTTLFRQTEDPASFCLRFKRKAVGNDSAKTRCCFKVGGNLVTRGWHQFLLSGVNFMQTFAALAKKAGKKLAWFLMRRIKICSCWFLVII